MKKDVNDSQPSKTVRLVNCVLLWGGVFFALYIFYRYAHPIVPWCGDDWYTYCDWGTSYIFFDLPKETLPNYNIALNILGSLAGYIAAFIVYPICGDYIMSLVTVNAIMQAASICIVLASVWWFLHKLTDAPFLAWGGTILFLLSAFMFMKTTVPSDYLFLVEDVMPLYAYNLPSYCAFAFSLCLIINYLNKYIYIFDVKSSLMLACLYFLMFSFLPASILITTVSGTILLYDMIRKKRIWGTMKANWFLSIAVCLFPIKAYLEIIRTFGTGYISTPTDFINSLNSFSVFVLSSFTKMHVLFKVTAVVGGIGVLANVWSLRHDRQNNENRSEKWKTLLFVLPVVLGVLLVFYILFGTVSPASLCYVGFVRTGSMYCLYALVILTVVLFWVFLLQKHRRLVVCFPLLLVMLFGVIGKSSFQYRESYFMDTTAHQKYEIMDAIFNATCAKDERGETQIIIHMPQYLHWESSSVTTAMYLHNITDRLVYTQFVYDVEPGGDVWFE